MGCLRIGEVAARAEVGVETIRYYEREGLLAEPRRKPSGYRQYDESVVARLRFIRRTKELGFTLSEIKELLGLWFNEHTRCEHVRQRAEQKIENIDDKIRLLQKMKRSLRTVIKQCASGDSFSACPLWDGLDSPEGKQAERRHRANP
jgi:MerR family copper efflux transcriptional regulator